MSSITIFVVSGDAAAQAARALVESWTQAGILESSLWVAPADVVEAPQGPPQITATLVRSGGSSRVSLFEHVGRFRLDMVRIVAAHLILHEGDVDSALDATAGLVATSISAALPRRSDGAHPTGTRLHRSLVLIPVSGASGADMELTRPDWEVNAVISPEDRPDLDRADVFVRHPGNFEGHAANALAAVGGILRGVGNGVLDDISSDSTTTDGDVFVARVSIRAIIGDDMLDDVAARVLSLDDLEAAGPASMLPWARPASHPGEIAKEAAAHILRMPEWAPAKLPVCATTRKSHQGFWAALRTAASFNVRTSGAVVSWWLSRGRASFERGATEAIVGAQAGTLVTLGPRPVEDLTRASERLLQRERASVRETLDASRLNAPAATTWSNIRALAFALADGGDLEGFPEPRQAGKRELIPASYIVTHPDAVWTEPMPGTDTNAGTAADPEGHIYGDDPLSMTVRLEKLHAALNEAKAAVTVADAALRNAQKEREANPPDDDSGDDYWPDDATLASLAEELRVAKSAESDAAQAHERYKGWHDEQSRSMLWQIGHVAGERILQMQHLQEEIEARGSQHTPPAERLRRAQVVLRRWWLFTSIPWALVTATYFYAYFGPIPKNFEPFRPETDHLIWAVSVLFAIAFVILAAANHAFYKAVRAYEWDVEGLIDRIRSDRALYVHSGQERTRYLFLYETLRDWVRILGEALHRPWDEISRVYRQLPDSVIDALPASTGLAQQDDEDDSVSSTILMQSFATAYPRGWVSRQFETAYDAWEREQPSGSGDGYRPPDVDTLVNRASPRRRLLDFWVSGSARTVVTRRARKDLRDAVQKGEFLLPTRRVKRLGRFGDDKTYSERDFFAAMATESTAFTLDLFTSPAQLARKHYVDRSVAWLPDAARTLAPRADVEAHRCEGSIAVRVDISKRLSARELLPFTDGSEVQVVDAVITPVTAPDTTTADDVSTPWV